MGSKRKGKTDTRQIKRNGGLIRMREVAKRVFAKEYAQSNLQEREGDTEYAPSYIITPTGAKCNRIFLVGVLTEVTDIGTDKELYRARVSDPTGTFLLYAGNFQPKATMFLSEAQPPTFVAVTGKSNLYEPDEETSITSVRPEAINESTEEERDRWVVKTAEMTLKRVQDIHEKAKKYYDINKTEYYQMIEKSLKSVTQTEIEEELDTKIDQETDKTKEQNKEELESLEQDEEDSDEIEELDLTDI